MSELIHKAKSWTGPFVALYSSMLDFASFQNNSLGLTQNFIILFINTAFAIVLALPLIALVAVLFWRVIQLWIAIALSPFIVLKHVFDGIFGKTFDDIDGLNIKELVSLLFAPVMIGFAVSLSMMFMTILKTSLMPDTDRLYVDNQASAAQNSGQIERNREYERRIKESIGAEFKSNGQDQELELLGFIKVSIKSGLLNFTSFLVQLFGL